MQPTQALNKAALATDDAIAQSQPAKSDFDISLEYGGIQYAKAVHNEEAPQPFQMS